jgi:hypothetical protein
VYSKQVVVGVSEMQQSAACEMLELSSAAVMSMIRAAEFATTSGYDEAC